MICLRRKIDYAKLFNFHYHLDQKNDVQEQCRANRFVEGKMISLIYEVRDQISVGPIATHPAAPNQVWASDISYIPTDEGFLFLATIIDEAKKSIFEFMEVWYNRGRIHSSSGYQTPIQYEQSLAS